MTKKNKPRCVNSEAEQNPVPPLSVSSIPDNGTEPDLEQCLVLPSAVEDRYHQWLAQNVSRTKAESALVASWSD